MYLTSANDQLSELALEKLRLTPVKQGTLVFPKSGAAVATNNRAILDVDGYLVSHLMALEPGDSIMSAWVYYSIAHIDMMELSYNPGYPAIRKPDVEKILIPLPPLAEQRRIVAALEAQTAAADGAKRAAAETLNELRNLPGALLRQALAGELG